MNDLMLRGAIAADNMRRNVVNRATDIYANRKEHGDIVQTIIIIALFVLICVVVGGILYKAINGLANKVSNCISNANTGSCSNFK